MKNNSKSSPDPNPESSQCRDIQVADDHGYQGEEHDAAEGDVYKSSQIPLTEPGGLRRSSRTKAEPERLNIKSWSGQSYDSGLEQTPGIHYAAPYPLIPSGPFQYFTTPPNSVVHQHGLHHGVAGGGGGITGYGLPSNQMQSMYQTKYWSGQHSYPAQSGW